MKILLVEDSQSIRKSLVEFLVELGHTVSQAADGKDGWQSVQTDNPHLILSDIRMPNMDGHDLLKHIKSDKKFQDIPVVLFTGHGDVKGAVQAMKVGAYDYLLKPVNIQELAVIINRIEEYLQLRFEHKKLKEDFSREVDAATQDVKSELLETRKALASVVGTDNIGVYSDVLKQVFEDAAKLHENPDIPVLIEGETGTGKELIARYIHYGDGVSTTPFIPLNCAAISDTLFESELFGYEAGAFTGGNPKGQKGKLELAQDGSLFLDEITEMAFEHQAKLLRMLQEREFYKVGGLKRMNTEARFICATNQNAIQAVEEGRLRQDLYFRLNIGYLRIPPLRERQDEIVPLAMHFLQELKEKKRTTFSGIHPEAKKLLASYDWPGNIRELKNTIERVLLYWDETEILPEHLNAIFLHTIPVQKTEKKPIAESVAIPEDGLDLNQHILDLVAEALETHGGNKTKTAQNLGISLRVLQTYLKKLDLS